MTPVTDGDEGFYFKANARCCRRCDGQPANLLPGLQSRRRLRDRRLCLAPGLERPGVPGFAAEYEVNMAKFINDVRFAVGVPDLPFVIATTGME